MDPNRSRHKKFCILNSRRFKSWNWERDFGEGELTAADNPSSCAIAFYDFKGRLFRVCEKNPIEYPDENSENRIDKIFVYDYFCDEEGRVLEKRSLGDDGEIVVIVRYDYDTARGIVTETAWWPSEEVPPQSIERPI